MYRVQPDDKVETLGKPRRMAPKVNQVLQGTPSRPFGLYDFIITYTVVTYYFVFTGLCLLFKRKLPRKWLDLSTSLPKRETANAIKEKVMGVEQKKPVKTRVESISPRAPQESILA